MTKTSFGDQVQQMWQTRPVRLPRQGPIAGVAAGFGQRYGVDPVLVRVAFVVSTIFGGAGLVLYLLAWLLCREGADQSSAAEALIGKGHSSQSQTKTVVLVVALAIAVSTMGPVGVGLGGSGVIGVALMLSAWWMLHMRTPEPPEPAFGATDGGFSGTGYPGAVFPPAGQSPGFYGQYTPYTKLPDRYVPDTSPTVSDAVVLDKTHSPRGTETPTPDATGTDSATPGSHAGSSAPDTTPIPGQNVRPATTAAVGGPLPHVDDLNSPRSEQNSVRGDDPNSGPDDDQDVGWTADTTRIRQEPDGEATGDMAGNRDEDGNMGNADGGATGRPGGDTTGNPSSDATGNPGGDVGGKQVGDVVADNRAAQIESERPGSATETSVLSVPGGSAESGTSATEATTSSTVRFEKKATTGPSAPRVPSAPTATQGRTPPSWDPLGAAPLAWDLPAPAPTRTVAERPPKKPRSRFTPVVLGLAMLAAAGAGAAAAAGVDWMTPGRIAAVALAVVSIGLVFGAFTRRGYGLVTAAVPLAVFVVLASMIGPIDFDNAAMGERTWAPVTVADLQPEYTVTMGSGTLDLRTLELTENRSVDVSVRMGEALVLVPENMNVRAGCSVRMGEAHCPDGLIGPGGDAPVLTLNVDVSAGEAEVRRG